jgi:hypothetical protein
MRSNRPAFGRWIVIALLILAAACGGGDAADRHAGIPMDTLANGAVLVSNPATGAWDDDSRWTLATELVIGSIAGNGPDLFGEITGVEVDRLGRIYVADRQAAEVRVFNSDGSHVRTFGRRGRGPGEFEQLVGLGWGADGNLVVVDAANGYIDFDTTGTWIGVRRRETAATLVTVPWPGGFGFGGEIFDIGMDLSSGSPRRSLLRYSADLASVDTIPLPEYEQPVFTVQTGPGRIMAAPVPFAPAQFWAIDPAGSRWSGISGEYRLVQQDFSGDTIRIVEREHTAERVTNADMEAMMARLSGFAGLGGQIDRSQIPDTHPAFGAIFVDDRSNLWVTVPRGEASAPGFELDVFDAMGRYLGRVGSDVGDLSGRPVIRSDYIFAVVRDELEVAKIARLRIDRG